MNTFRVLCWKEYREQRVFWLAVALVATGLVPALALGLAPAGLGTVAQDPILRNSLIALILVFSTTYAVVCGAVLLGNEAENGTQTFLDTLPAARSAFWSAKVATGLVLVLTQVALLFCVSLVAEPASRFLSVSGWAGVLLIFAAEGYAWGLYAATRTPTVLSAAGLTVPLMTVIWFVAACLEIPTRTSALLWSLALSTPAFALSWRRYCEVDRARREPSGRSAAGPAISAWRVMLWLCWRQGRWQILVVTLAAAIVGGFLPAYRFWLWPIATLAVGILAGTEVFGQDQLGESYRHLGCQRLRPRFVWGFKCLFWLAVAFAALVIVLVVGQISFVVQMRASSVITLREVFESATHDDFLNDPRRPLLLVLWPAYGFASGLLFGQLFRKQILAIFMAAAVSVPLLGAWLPSLAGGGLLWWQLLFIPALFGALSLTLMWPWLTGRVAAAGPIRLLCGGGLVAVAWLGGNIAYRVVEIPETVEPFDVAAFVATFPEDNEAGQRLRAALQEMEDWQEATIIERLRARAEKEGPKAKASAPLDKNAILAETDNVSKRLDDRISAGRVSDDKELSGWLDVMFADPWHVRLGEAVRLPLGLLRDPRQSRARNREVPFDAFAEDAGQLLVGRALQLLERKDLEQSADRLVSALNLAQQVRHKADDRGALHANLIETHAISALRRCVTAARGDAKLLRRLLAAVTRQDELWPPVADTVRAEYLAWQSTLEDFYSTPDLPAEAKLGYILDQLPWEAVRQERLRNLLFASALHLAELPTWQVPPPDPLHIPAKYLTRVAQQMGVELDGSPGRALTLAQWERDFPPLRGWHIIGYYTLKLCQERVEHLFELRILQLKLAAMLHEAEHERPPTDLGNWVTGYLRSIPVNPKTGQPFNWETLAARDKTKG